MTQAIVSQGLDRHFQEEVIATAGGNSLPIYIPSYVRHITATAIPGGGGSATVQHTTSSYDAIIAGTATWINWDVGSVGTPRSQALITPVTAVRIQAVVADARLEVVGAKARM